MAKTISFKMDFVETRAVSEDIRILIADIKNGKKDADAALHEIAIKARNDFLNSHSLSRANMALAGLKEEKSLSKYLADFKAKFPAFCGLYASEEHGARGAISYLYDTETCAMQYDKKENAFYIKGAVVWNGLKPIEDSFTTFRVKKVVKKKEAKEIPAELLVQYLLARPDLQEILDGIKSAQENADNPEQEQSDMVDALVNAVNA
ncbi:MAG: hypothetical protein HDQ88_12135 [Clostridia bacterium]|nr:hypothetical protein [Clostridia bacterium]